MCLILLCGQDCADALLIQFSHKISEVGVTIIYAGFTDQRNWGTERLSTLPRAIWQENNGAGISSYIQEILKFMNSPLYCSVGHDLKLFTLETHLENSFTYYKNLATTFFLASSLVITPNICPPHTHTCGHTHSLTTEGFSPLLEHTGSFISVYFLHSALLTLDTIPHALAHYKNLPAPHDPEETWASLSPKFPHK